MIHEVKEISSPMYSVHFTQYNERKSTGNIPMGRKTIQVDAYHIENKITYSKLNLCYYTTLGKESKYPGFPKLILVLNSGRLL